MTTNPYAPDLGARDPLAVMAGTPEVLRRLAATIGGAIDNSPAPGKWSPREVLCHLADCEIAFGFRLRQTLAEDRHVMQPFDQDRWAAHYAGYSAEAALSAFAALRAWNVALIRTVPPDAFAKKVNHPERGEMTFATIVETIGGHDLHHVRQLEAIAAHT